MQNNALTVKQLNFYVRQLLEGDSRLSGVCVKGELSNFKNHYQSGHIYFTLKDNDAGIKCVMFRSFASRLKFRPEDGLKVILKGRVSLYEKDGTYQLYAEEMMPDGIGDIALAFEQIKEKLQSEGLFDSENKRALPKFPKRIAVITSPTGAAVRDIINILSRRWPIAEIVLCPVSVQGELAVPEMCDALERVYSLSDFDTVIIGRGGGSIEDLWAFNSEILARKIYESPIPVISAVGHETDFTICDFVADLRAPTPSAAAELAVPDINEISDKLKRYELMLKTQLKGKYSYCLTRLDGVLNSYYFKNPEEALVERCYEELDRLTERLKIGAEKGTDIADNRLMALAEKLDALSPLKVMARGYAAVSDLKGNAVRSAGGLNIGDGIKVSFEDGSALCEIKEKISFNGE